MVIILSDLLDEKGYKDGLKKLKENNWRIFLIHTLARNEIEPDLEGEVYLIDSENNRGKDVNINQQTLKNYQKNIEGYCTEVNEFSKKYDINYFKAVNDKKLKDLIFDTMYRKQGVR